MCTTRGCNMARLNSNKILRAHLMESTIAKIQKHLDALQARNAKLLEENQKLKGTISELKSLNSRVRRIPKSQPEPQQS